MENLSVLLLEDDDVFRQKIVQHLTDAETFDCFAFRTYNEAWDKYEELKKDKKKLDLLIVDIDLGLENMPYGGLEFAASVNKNRAIPTLILSSHYNQKEYAEKLKELGFNTRYYFPKIDLYNTGQLIDQVWNTIFDFQKQELSVAEYLLQVSRRIGILDKRGIYQFYSKDEIIYLASEDKYTKVYLTNKRHCIITAHLGHIGPLIQYNYPNIRSLNKRYWINLEKITSFDMRNEGERQSKPELTLEEENKIVLPRNDFQLLFSEGLLIQPKPKK